MNALVLGKCPKTVQQLAAFCDNVIIVLDHHFERERNLPEIDRFTVIESDTDMRSIRGIPKRAKEIRQWVVENDIKIVFSNRKWDMVAAKIASVCINRKIVLLATNHNSYSWQDQKKVNMMARLVKWTTDCYVCLASFVRDKLIQEGVREDKLVLVPNTSDYSSWDVKCEYGIASQIRIVYVAYVSPGKRQDFIVDVLYLLKEKYDIVADCYGDLGEFTDYEKEIQDKISRYGLDGKVNLAGKIENRDLQSKLKQYDIYICPSLMEMSPVNILEAQSAGLPVVASRVGGVPNIIIDGKTGLLFDVDSAADAASKLEMLIKDESLRKFIGSSGRDYVSSKYTAKEAGELIKQKIDRYLK